MVDKVVVNIESDTLTPALNALMARFDDLTPLMKDIAGIMEAGVADNFEAEGRPAWDALSAVTIKRREKAGHWPVKILQAEGKLANSIVSAHTATEAFVGTNDVRAKVLHFGQPAGKSGKTTRGAPIPWGTIPARPFMSLAQADIDEIGKAALAYAAPNK